MKNNRLTKAINSIFGDGLSIDNRSSIPIKPTTDLEYPRPVLFRGVCCSLQTPSPYASCRDDVTKEECLSFPGIWHEGKTCPEVRCPNPHEKGACCTDEGCSMSTIGGCDGSWMGAGTDCRPWPMADGCPPDDPDCCIPKTDICDTIYPCDGA